MQALRTGHFNDFLVPLYQGPAFNAGSTDVGDVSYQCPTAQIHMAVWPNHVPCHSWQVVSCNKTPLAHRATVHAGKVLCAAAIDLIQQPELLEQAKAYFPRLEGQVIAVENDFFGHTIDVAGLLTGQDLSAQLQRVPSLGRVLLPLHMLRHGETVFLDDYTVARLADELGCPVQIVGIDGGDLLDAMLDASSTVS